MKLDTKLNKENLIPFCIPSDIFPPAQKKESKMEACIFAILTGGQDCKQPKEKQTNIYLILKIFKSLNDWD